MPTVDQFNRIFLIGIITHRCSGLQCNLWTTSHQGYVVFVRHLFPYFFKGTLKVVWSWLSMLDWCVVRCVVSIIASRTVLKNLPMGMKIVIPVKLTNGKLSMLDWCIGERMVSMMNIKSGIKEPTSGYPNHNISQVYPCVSQGERVFVYPSDWLGLYHSQPYW